MLAIWSHSSAFSKSSLKIWKFTVHILLKPGLENFEYYLVSCEMSAIVQQFERSLALPFFGIGIKTDLFQSCGHCWVFQICWHIECSKGIWLQNFIQDWGNRPLEGTNKILYVPEPRRKEQWPHKRLTQTCLWVSRSLWWRCGLVVLCYRVRSTECGTACLGPHARDLLKEVAIIFITSTIVWSQVK